MPKKTKIQVIISHAHADGWIVICRDHNRYREIRTRRSHWTYRVAMDYINSLGAGWYITRRSDRYDCRVTATLDPLYEKSLFADHS